MDLPVDFVQLMRQHLSETDANQLLEGLCGEPSVSVRINSAKLQSELSLPRVPWCPEGYYTEGRPAFTFDPLLHSGVYYVQEASSMFLDEVLCTYLPQGDLVALDLCAAPGGKSTLIRNRLTKGSLLVSNEPVRQRAQVLAENMVKWGDPSCVVTQNYPDDFSHLPNTFDLVVADVPCSGEGMFRKDEQAVRDWSLENVDLCWRRQRSILESIWPTLKPGGLLVYSTCTFNRFEDEDNVEWISKNLGADVLSQRHFFPGRDRGEGFFIAALRKHGEWLPTQYVPVKPSPVPCLDGEYLLQKTPDGQMALPVLHASLMQKISRTMNTLVVGVKIAELKGRDWIPSHALAVSKAYVRGTYPEVELSRDQAIAYLRREVLRVEAAKGIVLFTYRGVPLGFAKNVGNRANNLYPQEWRIRTTYNPDSEFSITDFAV